MKQRRTRARAVIATLPDGTKKGWPAIYEAAEAMGVYSGGISRACLTGKPYRGTLWRYADEEGSD